MDLWIHLPWIGHSWGKHVSEIVSIFLPLRQKEPSTNSSPALLFYIDFARRERIGLPQVNHIRPRKTIKIFMLRLQYMLKQTKICQIRARSEKPVIFTNIVIYCFSTG